MFDTALIKAEQLDSSSIVSMTEAELATYAERSMKVPSFVVLARAPGVNGYRGIVENSLSVSTHDTRTQFFWSSAKATSNLGGKFVVDGRADAEEMVEFWSKRHPDWTFEIFDARDDERLPVHLDWQRWLNGCRPAETFSGVYDKYDARNLVFKTKEDFCPPATEAVSAGA